LAAQQAEEDAKKNYERAVANTTAAREAHALCLQADQEVVNAFNAMSIGGGANKFTFPHSFASSIAPAFQQLMRCNTPEAVAALLPTSTATAATSIDEGPAKRSKLNDGAGCSYQVDIR
jgi:hypothetical protein